MRIPLTAFLLSALTFVFGVTCASAQDISCSCTDTPENTCTAEVHCRDGCTAVCGVKDTCYVSCRTDLLTSPLTLRFVKKDGKFIAKTLSDQVKKDIQFEPYSRTKNRLYNFELKKSDMWPILSFLNKRGKVTINGKDLRPFLRLQRQARRRRLSVRFENMPAKDAIERLTFLSRFNLRIRSGDPSTLVSLQLNDKPLSEILKEISKQANVKITGHPQKR